MPSVGCDEASSPQCPPSTALCFWVNRPTSRGPSRGGHPRRVTVWVRCRVPLGTSLAPEANPTVLTPPPTWKEAFGWGGGIFPKLQKMITHFRERMCLLPSFSSTGLRPRSTPRSPPSPLPPPPPPSPHLAEGEMPARWSHAAGLGTIGSCLEHAAASTHIWRPARATPVLIWRERAGRFVS